MTMPAAAAAAAAAAAVVFHARLTACRITAAPNSIMHLSQLCPLNPLQRVIKTPRATEPKLTKTSQ
jgi:hypothetical protein